MALSKQTAEVDTSYFKGGSDIGVLTGKKILQYPMGLGSSAVDEFGKDQHYMLFRIKTNEKSTRLKGDSSTGQAVTPAGTKQGVGVESKFNRPGDGTTLGSGSKSDTVALYGKDATNKQTWVNQKGMVNLDKVVVLPVPNDIVMSTNIKYDDDYGSTELTILGDIGNQAPGGVVSDVASLAKNVGIAAIVNSIKKNSNNITSLEAEDGLSRNPRKEVMYKSFPFRHFSFQFQFAPRSREESDMVKDIIETFRYYALPEITEGKIYYILPSEFDISFMVGQGINPNIPKIATCALERISVNYTPNSVWSHLPNNAPLSLSMSLEFVELELIDRSRIYKEGSPITSGY